MLQMSLETATLPANNMICVARPSTSSNLIVCFNGYGNRANAAPNLPFSTHLEGAKLWDTRDAHILWFAEEQCTWFLEHENKTVEILTDYIIANGIDRVKLTGGSAGGYAVLRVGLVLDAVLSARQHSAEILSLAINPQTGFHPSLFETMRKKMELTGWNQSDIGRNPILLSNQYQQAFSDRTLDIYQFAIGFAPKNFKGVIFYDNLNPIEHTFVENISSLPFIATFPQSLGVSHSAGCVHIWNHSTVWQDFQAMMPFEEIEPTGAEFLQLH